MQGYQRIVRDREAGWNSHDLTQIMSHYCDDIVFRSRKAVPLIGKGELRGKAELRAYCEAALMRQPDLRFEVVDIFCGHEMLVVSYRNQKDILATETLYFDNDGKLFQAAACHRAGYI